MAVTVYTKPSCVQCTATYRALDNKGIQYEVLDVSADEAALEHVKSLGYMQAPSSSPTTTTGRASVPTRSRRSAPNSRDACGSRHGTRTSAGLEAHTASDGPPPICCPHLSQGART